MVTLPPRLGGLMTQGTGIDFIESACSDVLDVAAHVFWEEGGRRGRWRLVC